MKFKVVIIEDNEDLLQILEEWMAELGSDREVWHFTRGDRALEFLERETQKIPSESRFIPNLIILDLGLPDQNGLEVLKKIKASPALKEIEVIVNSVSTDPDQLRNVYKFGSCAFIRKDGSSKALLDAIRRLVIAGRLYET